MTVPGALDGVGFGRLLVFCATISASSNYCDITLVAHSVHMLQLSIVQSMGKAKRKLERDNEIDEREDGKTPIKPGKKITLNS